MSDVEILKVRLNGISCAVPEKTSIIAGECLDYDTEEIEKICKNTGVRRRHIAALDQCTSDLCYTAATKLLKALKWDPETIDVLILVTQTSDYLLPATSCSLQQRLGISTGCAAFDVNLGCSGYVYGLWMMSSLLAAGRLRRGLLLAGDTISRICSPQDRSTKFLFGDAGSATTMEWDESAPAMHFRMGTDGSGGNHLIVPAGGFRYPHSPSTAKRKVREGDNIRSDEDLFMNGAEIFSFSLKQVPPLIKGVMENSSWSMDEVDAFVMHQANSFMLKHLGKKMKLPEEKVVIALEDFGNTSSASIPLALNTNLMPNLIRKKQNLILAGFGVGYSWGAVALVAGPLIMLDIITTDSYV